MPGRSVHNLSVLPFVAVLLSLAAPARPAHALAGAEPPRSSRHAAVDRDAPLPGWREGPVRYLLAKDEDDAFRALSSNEARAAFIRVFWQRRDAVRSTPENEYRDLFYRRVQESDRLFTDSTKPGWKTDRGKIYILLGPPDEQTAPPGDVNDARRTGRRIDYLLWTYRDPPAGTGVGPNSTIRFVRDAAGEYRMTSTLLLAAGETPLGVDLQTQALQMQSLPETRRLPEEAPAAGPATTAPLRSHGDFFRAADGNTLAVLTLRLDALPGSSGPAGGGAGPSEAGGGTAKARDVEVAARLEGRGPGLPSYEIKGAEFMASESEPLLRQGRVLARPGSYAVAWTLTDRTTGEVDRYEEALVVPDLRDSDFRLGNLTLASRIERVAWDGSAGAPFVFGSLRVEPRLGDLFRAGEDLAFYFEVAGAETDPIDGRPDLDVEYRFFLLAAPPGSGGTGAAGTPEADVAELPGATLAPFGNPILMQGQRTRIHGYALPLRDWPQGTYRLEVAVTDNLAARHAARGLTFHVR